MDEAKNEYKIDFGAYSVELKANQVYFRKNNSLVKAMPVKSTFGLYDLKKLVKKVAASVNMTSKLPKDVLKAEKEGDESPVVYEIKDQKLARLFQRSKMADIRLGEKGLYKLAMDWEDWNVDNDDKYDDLVDPLFAAVEMVQDNQPALMKKAKGILKSFQKDVVKAMRLHKESVNEAYYVWSGTYGKDNPKKMKDLVKVKDLDASIKQSRKHKAKHGNARAMLDREFAKQFPKAFKSLDEKRDLIQGDIEESTKQWTKTIKALAKQDQLKKITKKDKETLLKIVRLMKTANEETGRKTYAYDMTEDFVRSGHMYKSLTYKVKDSKAVIAAYKKFKAGNRTINMVVKSSGDTVTISGHPTKGAWISPGIADQLDAAIQKTGKATLVKSDSKKLKENKMNESEVKFRKMIREIAEPMLKESMNESYGVIDPRGNTRPVGSKIQGDRYVKGKKGYYVILMKHAMTARRAIEKAGGRATSKKIQDLMWDLRYEGKVNEAHKSDSDMLKLALKGIKAARVGNSAGAVYLKSLKNAWRLNPRDKKDYMDFTVDDWEEDVLYYIQNKG